MVAAYEVDLIVASLYIFPTWVSMSIGMLRNSSFHQKGGHLGYDFYFFSLLIGKCA